MLKNYDPQQLVASFRGRIVRGFGPDTKIKAVRAERTFTTVVGVDGDVTRNRSRNKTGTVTFTLLAESPSNDDMNTAADLDEAFGTGSGVLHVEDLNGTTLIHDENAWIEGRPDREWGKDASPVEWVIACSNLQMTNGGALT